jgi:hypothetical protein
MRRQSIAWERAAEVRDAADGWRRAGAIGAPTHEAIKNAYPDPCVTPSAVWRVLTAVMVTAVVLCSFGAFALAIRPREVGLSLLLWLFGGACVVATERLEGSLRLARRGAAGAAAFWGIVLFLGGLGQLLHEIRAISGEDALRLFLLTSALTWAAACWRWGSPLFAGLSVASVFVLLAQVPFGRTLWIVVGAVLVGVAARHLDDGALAPSHRRAAMVVLLVAVAAMYVALNSYSLDQDLLHELRPLAPQRVVPSTVLFAGAAVATALLPLGVLAWGWRSRRPVLLDAGIVLVALSLVTLRYYVHVAPLWAVLLVSGAALVALALAVERALRRVPGGEQAGFTTDALFSDDRGQRVLQVVAVAGTLTPAAAAAASAEKGFVPGGGASGGAGASDRF